MGTSQSASSDGSAMPTLVTATSQIGDVRERVLDVETTAAVDNAMDVEDAAVEGGMKRGLLDADDVQTTSIKRPRTEE